MHNIDELAHLSGVASRTIRFYNTQGLLPAPMMRGRVAYYDAEHLAVLNIIKDLKEQHNLPLETIKQLLDTRAQDGDIAMNLALRRRLRHPVGQELRISKEAFMRQVGISEERTDELVEQSLLFPAYDGSELIFTGDDVLLAQLYAQLEKLGLPLALPALIRFQLRQLVRSEIAAFEQHLQARWQQEGLSLERQAEQFENIFAIMDTLISALHRKLLYGL